MPNSAKMVKKETMLIALAITFLTGFLTGTFFTVYRLGAAKTSTSQVMSASAPEQQGITLSNEQAQAITALETEVEKNNGNGEAWSRLGNLYYDTHQFKKAIDAYNHALDILPANADILTDLGVMYRRDNQPEKALESFDKAIQTDPRHEPSRLNKGVVLLYDLGRTPEALQAWQELLGINPNATTPNGQSVRDLMADVAKEVDSSEKQDPKAQ